MTSSRQNSELTLNAKGNLYHINLNGNTLADDVLLVGDPQRIEMFRGIFDRVEFESQNRELHALTGYYHGHRFTALSTGMGCDNIDIVATELDAAANIDLATRTTRPQLRTLNLVRIGTSGSLQAEIGCGSLVASKYALGMDGLLNYYQHSDQGFEPDLQAAFEEYMRLNPRLATPYAVSADQGLLDHVGADMAHGITVTAPGFYGPQGRDIRLHPSIDGLNDRLASFTWQGTPITNLEMETSAIYGFARALGHKALTVCLIIANRPTGTFMSDYHDQMRQTLGLIVERMA